MNALGRHGTLTLKQLSNELARIAVTLARSTAQPGISSKPEPVFAGAASEVSAEIVNSVIQARRRRNRYFAGELFADPAWDMMLDLLEAEISYRRVAVSSLGVAAAVPATTALRWIRTMERSGMLIRRPDLHDGRRMYIELSPQVSQALRRYFVHLNQI